MRGGKRENAGRPKGSPNKTTDALRVSVNMLIDDNWESIQEDMASLSPKERIDTVVKLLDFALPRLSRQENVDTTSVEYFMSLSSEERTEMKREIESKLNKK